MVAFPGGSGLFGNQSPPKYITGAYYLPVGYHEKDGGTATSTATRIYYFPVVIWSPKAFAGAAMYNNGAGDNGEKIRIMIFRDDAANGGPGTLEKDFGEITLTAAAALRTLSSTWNASPGVYWGAIWFESASAYRCMAPYELETVAGFGTGPSINSFIGSLTAPPAGPSYVSGHYVDTAYGAAPATAVAPTASFVNSVNNTAGVGGIPVVWLKG